MVIFKYEWRQLKWYVFWWSIVCGVSIFVMYPVYLGFITLGMEDFPQLANNPIFDLLGVDPYVITKPIGMFGFLTSFFAIAAGINGLFLGVKTFAKETIGKSAEFLYTKPYKLKDIYVAKVMAAVVATLVIGFSYYFGAMMSGYLNVVNGFDFKLFSLTALSFLWIELFFVLLGALVGVSYPKIRTPLLFSSGVVFIYFVIASFASKVGFVVIKYFTPYAWFGASTLVKSGGYDTNYLMMLLLFCSLFVIIGLSVFVKKDTTLVA